MGYYCNGITQCFLLILAVVSVQWTTPVAGYVCFSCDRNFQPAMCMQATQCSDDQACYLERGLSDTGSILYYSGCMSQSDCLSQNVDHFNVEQCMRCCLGDLCNIRGCGSLSIASDEQRVCMTCKDQEIPESCLSTTVCSKNQMCGVGAKEVNGKTLYDFGCIDTADCSKNEIECCGTSGCNFNLTANVLPSITQPSPTPSLTALMTPSLTPSQAQSLTLSLTPNVTHNSTTSSPTSSPIPNPTPSQTPRLTPSITPSLTSTKRPTQTTLAPTTEDSTLGGLDFTTQMSTLESTLSDIDLTTEMSTLEQSTLSDIDLTTEMSTLEQSTLSDIDLTTEMSTLEQSTLSDHDLTTEMSTLEPSTLSDIDLTTEMSTIEMSTTEEPTTIYSTLYGDTDSTTDDYSTTDLATTEASTTDLGTDYSTTTDSRNISSSNVSLAKIRIETKVIGESWVDGSSRTRQFVMVQCEATGSPNPTVQWSHIDRTNTTFLASDGVLVLSPLDPVNDNGLYECLGSCDNGAEDRSYFAVYQNTTVSCSSRFDEFQDTTVYRAVCPSSCATTTSKQSTVSKTSVICSSLASISNTSSVSWMIRQSGEIIQLTSDKDDQIQAMHL